VPGLPRGAWQLQRPEPYLAGRGCQLAQQGVGFSRYRPRDRRSSVGIDRLTLELRCLEVTAQAALRSLARDPEAQAAVAERALLLLANLRRKVADREPADDDTEAREPLIAAIDAAGRRFRAIRGR
jgi:hypothetical protein